MSTECFAFSATLDRILWLCWLTVSFIQPNRPPKLSSWDSEGSSLTGVIGLGAVGTSGEGLLSIGIAGLRGEYVENYFGIWNFALIDIIYTWIFMNTFFQTSVQNHFEGVCSVYQLYPSNIWFHKDVSTTKLNGNFFKIFVNSVSQFILLLFTFFTTLQPL